MPRRPSLFAVFFLIGLLLVPSFEPGLQAQAAPPPPTPAELDQLLAPVALYPDSLLAQITTASTNPQEILDVDNWLADNQNLTGTALTDAAQQQGFDPAFIALVNFPQIIQMMADHIDDYAAIGEAFTADQAEVSASIQRLRAQAYASGALRSTPEQQVEVQEYAGQPTYIIQPVNPQVVYIPEYDPTVVYVRPAGGAFLTASLLSFGVGIGIGALLIANQPWGWGGWGWNWGGHRVYYNHSPWGGWHNGYRPPRPWFRPRPVVYANRPGYRGNWSYRPSNYRPPTPNRRPGASRPGYNRPGYNRPGNNRPGNTPGNNRPGNNRPAYNPGNSRPGTTPGNNRPGNTRPGYNPGNNRPGTTPGNNHPGNGNRPTTQQVKPGTPSNRPAPNRPSAPSGNRPRQNRPAANRPAPNSRPNGAHPQNNSGQHGSGAKNNKNSGGKNQKQPQ